MSEFLSRFCSVAERNPLDIASFRPQLFDPTEPAAWGALLALLGAPAIEVVDTVDVQLEELLRARAPRRRLTDHDVTTGRAALLGGEPVERFGVWAYYAWSRRLVHVLPRELHQELRFDRNRHKITTHEQQRLLARRVGVVGLSVGRAVVSTLVREGIGGEFALADFDNLSLSNLNRLAGSLADLGINKAVLAAREIAELDPFVRVHVFVDGLNDQVMADFFDRVDIIVDECDDLAMKIALREEAQRRRLPVVMATSDRGMLDVERFDLQPQRPIFHGLLPGITADHVRGLSTKEKVPFVLRIFDAERLDPRMKASLVEINESLTTWPQVASAVALGGAMVTDVVRRMFLDEFTDSGRFECDISNYVRAGGQVDLPPPRPFTAEAVCLPNENLPPPLPAGGHVGAPPTRDEFAFLVACGVTAPSGGNMQPWRFEANGSILRASLDPARSTSRLNFRDRGGYLALGAALHNVQVASEHLGFDARVEVSNGEQTWVWQVTLARTRPRVVDPRGLETLFRRCTNRQHEDKNDLSFDELAPLIDASRPLTLTPVRAGEPRAALALALAELDRLRFLSPSLHREIFSEIRLDAEQARRRRDGIDVASLALAPSDLATIALLRSAEAMSFLAREGLGGALGNVSHKAFTSAPGVVIASCPAATLGSLVRAGSGLQRMWIRATDLGIAVHPWGSPFLFQRLLEDPASLEPWEAEALWRARRSFETCANVVEGESVMLVLRLARQGAPVARSLRRDVADVLTFLENS